MDSRSLRLRFAGLSGCLRVIREWRTLEVGQTVILELDESFGSDPVLHVYPVRRMPDGSMMWLGFGGWQPAVIGEHMSLPRGVITRIGLGTFTYKTTDGTLKCSIWPLVRTYLWGPL